MTSVHSRTGFKSSTRKIVL